MENLKEMSNTQLEDLLNEANVNHKDELYDSCYLELLKRDALPFDLHEDFECEDEEGWDLYGWDGKED